MSSNRPHEIEHLLSFHLNTLCSHLSSGLLGPWISPLQTICDKVENSICISVHSLNSFQAGCNTKKQIETKTLLSACALPTLHSPISIPCIRTSCSLIICIHNVEERLVGGGWLFTWNLQKGADLLDKPLLFICFEVHSKLVCFYTLHQHACCHQLPILLLLSSSPHKPDQVEQSVFW